MSVRPVWRRSARPVGLAVTDEDHGSATGEDSKLCAIRVPAGLGSGPIPPSPRPNRDATVPDRLVTQSDQVTRDEVRRIQRSGMSGGPPPRSDAGSWCVAGRRRPAAGPTPRSSHRRAALLADPARPSHGCTRRGVAPRPVVVELARRPGPRSGTPRVDHRRAVAHTPATEPWFDRLHFLVWANNYDARTGEPVWWWSTKAARLAEGADGVGPADDRRRAPRRRHAGLGRRRPPPAVGPVGSARRGPQPSRSTLGALATVPPRRRARPPSWPPTSSRRSPTAAGPARIIAPAGSGKTRVLTERLRHLLVDRGYERGGRARRRLQQAGPARDGGSAPPTSGPGVRTLNALGLWVLAAAPGSPARP